MQREDRSVTRNNLRALTLAIVPLAVVVLLGNSQTAVAQSEKPKIVHDAEYYILDAQHGEQWTVEDKDLDRQAR